MKGQNAPTPDSGDQEFGSESDVNAASEYLTGDLSPLAWGTGLTRYSVRKAIAEVRPSGIAHKRDEAFTVEVVDSQSLGHHFFPHIATEALVRRIFATRSGPREEVRLTQKFVTAIWHQLGPDFDALESVRSFVVGAALDDDDSLLNPRRLFDSPQEIERRLSEFYHLALALAYLEDEPVPTYQEAVDSHFPINLAEIEWPSGESEVVDEYGEDVVDEYREDVADLSEVLTELIMELVSEQPRLVSHAARCHDGPALIPSLLETLSYIAPKRVRVGSRVVTWEHLGDMIEAASWEGGSSTVLCDCVASGARCDVAWLAQTIATFSAVAA